MLRPFILIGVGGSGGKTLRIVRHELERHLSAIGWQGALPVGWQFLHVDVPSVADGDDPDLPRQLPHSDYVGLVSPGVNYQNIDLSLAEGPRSDRADAIAGWRPLSDQVTVPVGQGAGQFRALGRMIALANLARVKRSIDESIRNVGGQQVNAQLQQLTRLMGGEPSPVHKTPVAVVVSSIAGGSGAGAIIDVADVLRLSGEEWAKESMGILYAPDVFDYLPEARRRGVRPNALATLSELTAGYWNKEGFSPESVVLLENSGAAVGRTSRQGPRTPFLVGSRNDAVTYRSQNDIYQAMGRSLASWMTSVVLQDRLDAYVSGNWASTAISVRDELPLKTPEMETPFTAMGSARVSLGRDRFREWAGQRLARLCVESLLERHMESVAPGDDRSSQLVADEVADDRFPVFLANSGLNERTEHFNDILDALRPLDATERFDALSARLYGAVVQGHEKPLPRSEWHRMIVRGVKDEVDREVESFEVGMWARARAWRDDVQVRLREVAATALAREGYEVTHRLLGKLRNELTSVRTELIGEATRQRNYGDQVSETVNTVLSKGGDNALPAHSQFVKEAVRQAAYAVEYLAEAKLRDFVVAILPDLVENAVAPLCDEVRRAGEHLKVEAVPSGGRPSAIASWPREGIIPSVLRPAANELLLESPETFERALGDLVVRSVPEGDRMTAAEALRVAVREIVTGRDASAQADSALVRPMTSWVPQAPEFHIELSAPSRAGYRVDMSSDDLLARAFAWLDRPGTSASRFVHESLNSYLSPDNVEPAEHHGRLERFEQQLAASVDAAQPLVGIKKSVLVAVHQRDTVESEIFFSEFPVSLESPGGQVIKSVLSAKGAWSDQLVKNFVDTERASIDAFTVLTEPYEPVVFDSLMKPIAEEWGNRSKTADGREEFWRWRRARPLPEFIPVAPSVRKAMVRGWFTAAILQQLVLDPTESSIFVPSPQAGVPGTQMPFPSPLLATTVTAPYEYLPIVLESLTMALVDVNVSATLDPVKPYTRLRRLGESGAGELDSYQVVNSELADWIRTASLAAGAPTPRADQVGSVSDTPEQRLEAVRSRLAGFRAAYQKVFDSQRVRERQNVVKAFELERDIMHAFGDMLEALDRLEVGGESDDAFN
ncbi:MAG: tubulin-like doman-containing protein [Actinobacteria bacterium]|nr:tubulin-like doman-containing protein [Actinomycetota bacterium]MBU2110941.1 tubulin-like doman-containing protein [Actinomycetota bacterium]